MTEIVICVSFRQYVEKDVTLSVKWKLVHAFALGEE